MKANIWLVGVLALGVPAMATAQQSAAPASAVQPAAQAHAAPLPVTAFAQLPFIAHPRLSPDGTRLAGLFNIAGEQAIAIRSLFDKTDKGVMIRVPDGTQVEWLSWVNDDNILVGLDALLPFGDSDTAYVSRAVAVNRLTGKITKLLWNKAGQNSADLLWTATDGKPDVLIAAQDSIYADDDGFWPTVYRVNVESGASRIVQTGRTGIYDWDADASGRVRMGNGYRDDNRSFWVIYRGETGDNFHTIDRADTRRGESTLHPFLFMPGTNHAMAVHTDDKDQDGVYEVDLSTLKDVSSVFSVPAGSEISGTAVSYDGTRLLGIYTSDRAQPVVWLDKGLKELQAAFDKAVGSARRARIVDWSRDRTRFLVQVDRADNPGALYYFSLTGATMQRVAFINDVLEQHPQSPVSVVHFKARDGLPIEAILTLPKDRPAKNLPIVVLPHGGPWAQDTPDYDYWAQFVASRGYLVIQPNFRGSTGYGDDFTRKGEGQLGLAMQDDLNDALNWAVAQGIADPRRACIMGASYGGYAALWGGARDPQTWRCVISIAGVSNLRADVNDFGSDLMGKKFKDDWKRMTPDFAAVSPIYSAQRFSAPVLLIHGKKDITVEVSQSQHMYDRLRSAGKNVDLMILPKADHYFTRQDDRVALLSKIKSFLLKYNPPDPAN